MKVLGPDSENQETEKIQRLVDMTIAYPEGKPLDLQTIVTGWRPACNTHVHYRSWDMKVNKSRRLGGCDFSKFSLTASPRSP